MMFPVAYLASYYQPRRQFLHDININQRIYLVDRIYFLCLRHLSRKTDNRLIIVSLLLSIISSEVFLINFQFAVKSTQGVHYYCKPTCKTLNCIVLHRKTY